MEDQEDISEEFNEWCIENIPDASTNKFGITSLECRSKFNQRLTLPRICNLLNRMVDMKILSRRKTADGIYEYFRIVSKHEGIISILKSKLERCNEAKKKLRTSVMNLTKNLSMSTKRLPPSSILVRCSCGKMNVVEITVLNRSEEPQNGPPNAGL